MQELDCLNSLYDKYAGDDEFLSDDKLFTTIEKGLKVFEIFNKKHVSIEFLHQTMQHEDYRTADDIKYGFYYSLETYNENQYADNRLTQEEYDTIKKYWRENGEL